MIYGLFRSVLCSRQVSRNFPVIFLLLISGLIPLWSENKSCMLSILLIVKVCFLSQGMVYLSVMFYECLKSICIQLSLNRVFNKCWLDPWVDDIEFFYIFADFLPGSCWHFNYKYRSIFPFHSIRFRFTISQLCHLVHTHLGLLSDWLFCHYVIVLQTWYFSLFYCSNLPASHLNIF